MNKVILSGRWSKDIETKEVGGKTLAKSSLAVDDGYGDKKQTFFFDVEMWGKTADAVASYSGKGKRVLIEGRLKVDQWEKDGQRRTAVRVIAEQVEFLEPKQQGNKDPFADSSRPLDISDSDLPF
ncbi:hypothetical protein SD71_10625 [Cohnella kolymensis]|uniref:Single-stranded DNA-binding protein n=1 Tax=Cohnella kolymensis TaxID=1590652 RepID=A0ABR5A472_9BACL|nr:single-stranded DNA-binding protein [Cohnella kolymensis]KIL35844.1 hypothetical protein SD71_10625 [Cohnella kolymensis]